VKLCEDGQIRLAKVAALMINGEIETFWAWYLPKTKRDIREVRHFVVQTKAALPIASVEGSVKQ